MNNNSPKKILFIYYKLFKPGGITRVLTSLTNELVNDYDVTILVLMKPHESFYPISDKVKLIYVDSFSHWAFAKCCVWINKYLKFLPKKQNLKNYLYDFGVYQTVNQWLSNHHQDYDTIITCMYKLSSGVSMNRKFSYKTIAWEHSSHHLGGKIWRSIRSLYFKNLKSVITINNTGLEFYKKLNPNIFKIYNIMSGNIEKMQYIPQNEKKNIIGMVANYFPAKNIVGFLEIIKNTNLGENWEVQIMGDGMQKNKIEKYYNENNLQDKVKLLGSGTPEQVHDFLSKSKIICMTSLTETLPTVLIEAMFYSNVLISYDCRFGPRDIVNQNNGFLLPMHDKEKFKERLEFLISNPTEIERLSKSSFEESNKWKKEVSLRQWKEVL